MRPFVSRSILSILSVCALCPCVVAQTSPDTILALANQQAESALRVAYQEVPSALAARLETACESLRHLDTAAYREVCEQNPAFLWARAFPKAERPPKDSAAAGAARTQSTPAASRSDAQSGNQVASSAIPHEDLNTTAAVDAIKQEIAYTSALMIAGAERSNALRRLKAESLATILLEDLRKSAVSKSEFIPTDPLALVSSEALDSEIGAVRSLRNQLRLAVAVVDIPETTATLEEVEQRLKRLEDLKASGQCERFHRAREDISAAIQPGVWDALKPTRPTRESQRLVSLTRDWEARFPALRTTIHRGRSAAVISQISDPQFPLSSQVLDSTRAFALDQVDWLVKESALVALYGELCSRPKAERLRFKFEPPPSYQTWKVSLLSPNDIRIAENYAKSIVTSNGSTGVESIEFVPFDPNGDFRAFHLSLLSSLTDARTSSPALVQQPDLKERAAKYHWNYESEASVVTADVRQRLAFVNLCRSRYKETQPIPDAARKELAAIILAEQNKDLATTRAAFSLFLEASTDAASVNGRLDPPRSKKLERARTDLAALLEKQIEIDEARSTFSQSHTQSAELLAMLATLGARPPPGPSGPVQPAGPLPPAGDASTATQSNNPHHQPQGPSGFIFADATFIEAQKRADASLRAFRQSVKREDLMAVAIGKESGRYSITEDSVWQEDFGNLRMDNSQSRLDQEWKGLVDDKGKVFPYSEVLSERCAPRCTGGGIHLGSTAVPTVAKDWRDFILQYDEVSGTIVMRNLTNGEEYRSARIEPDDFKALLRFALSNKNGAITIGWTGTSRQFASKSPGHAVMIDPLLADTKVGRDLIVADSIPWRLHEPTLPGGIANPISSSFANAKKKFDSRKIPELENILSTGLPLSPSYATLLAAPLKADNTYLGIATAEVLVSRSVPEARVRFVQEAVLGGSNSAAVIDELDKLFDEIPEKRALLWALTELGLRAPPAREVISFTASDESGSGGGYHCSLRYLRVAAALIMSDPKIRPDQRLQAFYEVLPTTTISVLMDHSTGFSLEDGRLTLSADLRVHYLTSKLRKPPVTIGDLHGAKGLFELGTSSIRQQSSELGDGVDVYGMEEISGLAQQVTSNMKVLSSIPVYTRVHTDAAILGLLRWASQPGTIRGTEFSALTKYRGNDRKAHPTADEVLSSH